MTIPTPYNDDELKAAFPEFTFAETLGEGSFKVAYRVIESNDNEFVLKVVKSPIEATGSDSDRATDDEHDDFALPERVRRELEAMRQVASDHVVHIVNEPEIRTIGSANCLWYLESFYSGGTLRSRLGSPIQPSEVKTLAGDLLGGIEGLAAENLVHRDIKPENIVFDASGEAVLLDLGIALHMELEDMTSSDSVSPKTDKYAAPEQFKPKRESLVDHRTDLFQVGIVLFEALTGVHPFNPVGPRDAYISRLEAHLYDATALDAVEDADELKTFILRLLKPSPNQRYRTIGTAIAALGEVS